MPVDWSKYPSNWKSLTLKVKNNANWTCQQCNKPCRRKNETWEELKQRLSEEWLIVFHGGKQRFTLTTAHLNHDTTDNRPENLKALCSVCHLKYDSAFHAANRKKKVKIA